MPISKWSGCSYLSIDPGISYTGWATYKIPMLKPEPELQQYGCISPPGGESNLDRLPFLLDQVEILGRNKPAFVLLELPPDTIYTDPRAGRNQIIGRAQSVMKLMGVTYAIWASFRMLKIEVFTVLPVKWQERSKAKRGNADTKTWSLEFANVILRLQGMPFLESTGRNENIADAISLGYRAYVLGHAG